VQDNRFYLLIGHNEFLATLYTPFFSVACGKRSNHEEATSGERELNNEGVMSHYNKWVIS
jgi:hypothetical protein